jgi:hypothetical protein
LHQIRTPSSTWSNGVMGQGSVGQNNSKNHR